MEDKFLDEICQIAAINLYSLGKDIQRINLIQFNRKNESHLGLFEIAVVCSKQYDFDIYVDTNWLDYLILKFKNRKKIDIKKYKKTSKTDEITCNAFIEHICLANNCTAAFYQIYRQFFKEDKK